jgi:hypothetical protein
MRPPPRVRGVLRCVTLLLFVSGARSDPPPRDGGPEAATALEAVAYCDPLTPGVTVVELRWKVAEAAVAAEQRVDVAGTSARFREGTFAKHGALSPGTTSMVLRSVEPGIAYRWRVLSKTAQGWVASATGRFDGPTCPVDQESPGR